MIVECRGLGRSFGSTVAVDSLAFDMEEGEFLGLLGSNGAGKTTLLHMLTTMLAPSRGEARVLGADVRREPERVRAGLGMVFQDPALDARLTARENLALHADLHALPRREVAGLVAAALEWGGLAEVGDRLVSGFSGGMRRRLELARALMHRPRLLVLDEPTLGLDPEGRRDLWRRVEILRRDDGVSVLMTTHNLVEAERCGRLLVMDRGRLVAQGAPAELKMRHVGRADATLDEVFLRVVGHSLAGDGAPAARVVPMSRRRRGWRR